MGNIISSARGGAYKPRIWATIPSCKCWSGRTRDEGNKDEPEKVSLHDVLPYVFSQFRNGGRADEADYFVRCRRRRNSVLVVETCEAQASPALVREVQPSF
jgi:hypothetical protein